MTEIEIIEEIKRYLTDSTYNYAVMIDGDWGCGKTYFVNHGLTDAINTHEKDNEKSRKPIYISLYGCKSITDIQDNIAIELPVSGKNNPLFNKLRKNKTIGNVFQSTLKIAKAARDLHAPNVSIYEIAEIWGNLSSYIFIFDDIERCSCPLNEVFGFINGLVEHEGAKVILIANEKEINIADSIELKELQYLIALNEKVQYPKTKNIWGESKKDVPLSPTELDRRRRILFPEELVDSDFKKIREKLIGVTLHYQPNIRSVCQEIIENSSADAIIKEKLCNKIGFFYSIMEAENYFNLRTFQFFLSKLLNLFSVLQTLSVPEQYYNSVEDHLIEDCFSCAVDFKSNKQPPKEGYDLFAYEVIREKRSKVIDHYIKQGELNSKMLNNELTQFIERNLVDLIPPDDPFKMLQQEFYLHPQSWCEDKMNGILAKLIQAQYPFVVYEEILKVFLRLEEYGFDKHYLEDVKIQMITNINSIDSLCFIGTDLDLYFQNEDSYARAEQVFGEINTAIAKSNNEAKQRMLAEALSGVDWVEELTKYIEKNDYETSQDCSVFEKIDIEEWLSLLETADPETLYRFRLWLGRLYPKNAIRYYGRNDLPTLQELVNRIDPGASNDLVQAKMLQFLKCDLNNICQLYANIEG